MKHLALTFFLILFFTSFVYAQRFPLLVNYSYYTENEIVQNKKLQERINQICKNDSLWIVELTIPKNCDLKLQPELKLSGDKLFVEFITISRPVFMVHSGRDLERKCAYIAKIDISTDTIKNLIIDRKQLPLTSEPYEPYEKEYFTYKNDTTGFKDNYGNLCGYDIYEKNGFVMKQFYKDNEPDKCELYREGKLIETSYDCFYLWNRIEKK